VEKRIALKANQTQGTPLTIRPGKPRRIGALVALGFLSAVAGRVSAEENYDLFRYGSQSCDEWVRHSDLTDPETPKWFLNLVAGLSQGGGYRIDLQRGIKPDEARAWLDRYCAANPLDGLAVAATAWTNELAARAVKKE
jgi:hypothetical protein